MMRRMGWGAVVGLAVTALGVASSAGSTESAARSEGQAALARACSVATLKGAYGIQMQGTRPSGPPPAPMESVIGVVLRTYDGLGGFVQFDNIKGSLTGIADEPREGFGTYVVNADCTGETTFDPGTGVVIVERLMIVDKSREVFSIVATPLPVMVATVQKKID